MATIQKRGENSYRLTCHFEGKRYRKTIKAKSKTEAKKMAVVFEATIALTNEKDYSKIILVKFAQKWLNRKRDDLAAKTLVSYKGNLNRHILPYLGKRRINTLKPIDFIEFYDFLKTEKKLSGRTININHRIMNIMFNDAVKWELIESNPLKKIDAPKYKRKKDNYYNLDQVKCLLSTIDSKNVKSKYRIAVYIGIYSGFRSGEILGLEWKDINFDEMIITVRRSSIYADGKIITKEPKNESSIRNIYFGETLKKELLEHKKHQDMLAETIPDWIESDRLLTKNNGEKMFPQTVGSWFAKFIKKNNLDKITFHGLRHTAATFMIANGTDIRTVAERLGHANANTTAMIYSHHLKRANKQAALDLENFITKS